MDALKEGHERNMGAKSQRVSSDLPTLTNEVDKVTSELSWAERMEFKSGKAGDQICPVKVGEAVETILQEAFTPLKNADRLTLKGISF